MKEIIIRRFVDGERSRAEVKATDALLKYTEAAGMVISYYAVGPDTIMAVFEGGENFLLYSYDRRGRLYEIDRPKESFAKEYKRIQGVTA